MMFIKRYYKTIIVIGVSVLLITGGIGITKILVNNAKQPQAEIVQDELKKEEIEEKENEETQEQEDNNTINDIPSSGTSKPNINNNTQNNNITNPNIDNNATNDEVNDNTFAEEEQSTQDIQKPTNPKIAVCKNTEKGNTYIGDITATATFENDTIIYFKMYIEKSFLNEYKAEEDSWTISIIEALKNPENGISGTVEIKNNITYVNINYDILANLSLINLVATYAEYKDYMDSMVNEGWKCS